MSDQHIIRRNPLKVRKRQSRPYATQKAKEAVSQAKRADIRQAAHEIRVDKHQKIAKLAQDKGITVNRAKQELGYLSALEKKTRTSNKFNVFMCWKVNQINDGMDTDVAKSPEYQAEYEKMPEVQLKEIVAEHDKWREREALGKRTRTKEQSSDVVGTHKRIKDSVEYLILMHRFPDTYSELFLSSFQLENLAARSNEHAILISASANRDATLCPSYFTTAGPAHRFLHEHYGIELDEMAQEFYLYLQGGVALNNTKRLEKARSTVRRHIDNGLNELLIQPTRMEYSRYEDLIVVRHGVILWGYPLPGTPVNPDNIVSLRSLERIIEVFETGECHWDLATPNEVTAAGDSSSASGKKRKTRSDAGLTRKDPSEQPAGKTTKKRKADTSEGTAGKATKKRKVNTSGGTAEKATKKRKVNKSAASNSAGGEDASEGAGH
ncbi:hypothetical protein BOTBODRAFT_48523 [Botryobasidium botryosum FD-172 SS1]|uniref:Uncharacterized protein n=1 Tax=Botryobasidium botryosum (strain FD-172 SS1) TaxID=930990 RepID=A0A067M8F7_BOTB1|nr:hypothetical protein BOTBODRAFT_48523 [Botryobasidium botryosum FD-172 SS1]